MACSHGACHKFLGLAYHRRFVSLSKIANSLCSRNKSVTRATTENGPTLGPSRACLHSSPENTFRSGPPLYRCPACLQSYRNFQKLRSHLARCCGDLLVGEGQINRDGAQTFLDRLSKKEDILRKRVIETMYGTIPTWSAEETRESATARILTLPLERIALIARIARKAIPLFASNLPLDILHEDEDLIAINKPAGTTTTPAHRHIGHSILNRLIGILGYEPLPVHRLDMETTGIVIFAKNSRTARELQTQFCNRNAGKTYLAIVIGRPEAVFSVDAAISRHSSNKYMRCINDFGQTAQTSFRVLKSGHLPPGTSLSWTEQPISVRGDGEKSHAALVECMPRTGRTHQIRLHLAHYGCPILGDDLYGPVTSAISRQALHASDLTIWHPGRKAELRLTAPLPPDMESVLQVLIG